MEDRDPLSLLKSFRKDLQEVQKKVDDLVAILDRQTSRNSEGIPKPIGIVSPSNLALINSILQRMAAQQSQEGILSVLLVKVGQCADRAILFGVEGEKLAVWKSIGFASDLIASMTVSEQDSPLMEAAQTAQAVAADERISERFPWLAKLGPLPKSCLCTPLAFGPLVPVVLYTDSATEPDADSIALLVQLAVLHIQNHYLAHLLRKGEGSEAPPRQDYEAASTGRDYSDDSAEESWKRVEPLEREDSESLTEEEEEAAHAEARRLARLLVAEIKLYNEEEVEDGCRKADLYRRLRTDIDRSRKMYEKRVHSIVKSQADYFGSELVRVLARGDAALLGDEYEEPEVSNPIHQDSV